MVQPPPTNRKKEDCEIESRTVYRVDHGHRVDADGCGTRDHGGDSVNGIVVTPELLRFIVKDAPVSDEVRQGVLAWAHDLEVQAAVDGKIDEYAQIVHRAVYGAANGNIPNWIQSNRFTKDAYRAGVRALLAKLDEEKAGEIPDEYTEPSNLGFDPAFGDPVPYVNSKPRQWSSLQDVSADVAHVRDADGHGYVRDSSASSGWRWEKGGKALLLACYLGDYAPFTEVMGEDL